MIAVIKNYWPSEMCIRDRARTHTVKELLNKECQLMKEYFTCRYAKKLSSLSMLALLYEVSVTPKPGLVDRSNTGCLLYTSARPS